MDIEGQAKSYSAHLEDASLSKGVHYELREASPEAGGRLESYLMSRHGRSDLVPMPTMDPQDPFNWSSLKKHLLLAVVSLHAMSITITAAAAIPAFVSFVVEFGISITQASYVVTIIIGVTGVAPFFWQPFADRWGRRPVYLLTTICTAASCLAGAFCKSYGTMMITRALSAFFVASAVSLGAASLGEVFFQHEKGMKMGIWILAFGLGAMLGPLVMGVVVTHLNWHWVFYLLAGLHALLFILYLILVPETLYPRAIPGMADIEKPATAKTARQQYFGFGRIDHTPLRAYDFIRPWEMIRHINVILPTISYALVFSFTGVLLTVEIPALFGQKFELTAQGLGFQFVAPLIGSLIGEFSAGFSSDWYINTKAKKAGYRKPEMRLPVAWPGFLFACVGCIIYGVTLQNAAPGPWSARVLAPLAGCAIALVGGQIVSTVVMTYAIESHAPSGRTGDVSLVITSIRQLWAFVIPFAFTPMFETLGVAKAISLMGALCGAAILPILYLQWRARNNRGHVDSE